MKNLYENETYLRKKEMLIYGISNGGQVLGYSLISSYLMYFYINVFTIDAKIISLFFLIGGIWDIINNPLIGTFIDHKNSSSGKLTLLIKRFTPFQGIATIMIFMGPVFIKNTLPFFSCKNHLSAYNLFFMGILLLSYRCFIRRAFSSYIAESY